MGILNVYRGRVEYIRNHMYTMKSHACVFPSCFFSSLMRCEIIATKTGEKIHRY